MDTLKKILKIWLKKYNELKCPVCGKGVVSKGEEAPCSDNLIFDQKMKYISCLNCGCPLTPDWEVNK